MDSYVAIAILFAGEMLHNMFQLSPNVPPDVWLVVGGLFVVSFGLMSLAFNGRCRAGSSMSSGDG
jgi:hypothetical protein